MLLRWRSGGELDQRIEWFLQISHARSKPCLCFHLMSLNDRVFRGPGSTKDRSMVSLIPMVQSACGYLGP